MARRRYLVGMSTKMYFSHAQTLEWCRTVAELCRTHPAATSGAAELFVLPGYLSLAEVTAILPHVGAQDAGWADAGAFTGEVSAAELAEIGATYVEVGHAERRRLFGEDDQIVAAKTDAIIRNRLTPVLCVGETERTDPEQAVVACTSQIDSALAHARDAGRSGNLVVAYEPVWAIGAAEPASAHHITAVCGPLRDRLGADPDFGVDIIYGGSAGPGLLRRIGEHVDGLFLGRFAHDPQAVSGIFDDVEWCHASVA